MQHFHHRIQENSYEVVKRIKKGNYVLKELDGTLVRDTIAVFRVIGYLTRDDPELFLEDSLSSSEEIDGADNHSDEETKEVSDPEESIY